MTPGVSEDAEDEDEDVSGEGELMALIFCFVGLVPISFLGMDLVVPPESILVTGIDLSGLSSFSCFSSWVVDRFDS